jgi:hypothetical protein
VIGMDVCVDDMRDGDVDFPGGLGKPRLITGHDIYSDRFPVTRTAKEI